MTVARTTSLTFPPLLSPQLAKYSMMMIRRKVDLTTSRCFATAIAFIVRQYFLDQQLLLGRPREVAQVY